MFLNFSTEREFGSYLYVFNLGTGEWEPMSDEQMDEGGISLQCCVSMVRKNEVDLLSQTHAPDELRNSKHKTKV